MEAVLKWMRSTQLKSGYADVASTPVMVRVQGGMGTTRAAANDARVGTKDSSKGLN